MPRRLRAVPRLTGGAEAFKIPLGSRCKSVKDALIDTADLLATESRKLAKTAHACA